MLTASSNVICLESALDGTPLPADQLQTTHKDRPLWVRYDLESVGATAGRTRSWGLSARRKRHADKALRPRLGDML